MRTIAFLLFLGLLLPGPVSGQEEVEIGEQELRDLLHNKIRVVQHLALNPALLRDARRQNTTKLDLNEIKKRDEEWKNSDDLTHFKRSLQDNVSGRLLKRIVSSNPDFNEAFLTDDQGANVAAYPATSDYWQGDEEKWSESFNGGEGRLFLGPLERDASTDTYAVQISAPIFDGPETIGVLVVGVTLDYLSEKRGAR
ncbi:MAG: hypothetical protein GWN84_26420 [Gammaproteobacteria bacterium]|nr:hypothetical protein [Gammaproteobacteria bacterium]NIR85934.1 hypothetical protein [Gammaproteobacteria bacterium]NIR91926.1 hypothetical protein [Gammaproteobacteria bacterium]NIU07183.1 hypothetical protein [Gammaproteobacteria bacterium]NIV53996.1 hypothetical protein [Gammaproteobacteria bacterium]